MHSNVIDAQMSPLCFLPSGRLVCYSLGRVSVLEDGIVVMSVPVFNGMKERVLGRNRYLFRLLRLGVRASLALNEEDVLMSAGNQIYELNLRSGNLSKGFYCG